MTGYELWQLKKFGNILPGTNPQEEENGFQDRQEADIKADQQNEIDLIELQY